MRAVLTHREPAITCTELSIVWDHWVRHVPMAEIARRSSRNGYGYRYAKVNLTVHRMQKKLLRLVTMPTETPEEFWSEELRLEILQRTAVMKSKAKVLESKAKPWLAE